MEYYGLEEVIDEAMSVMANVSDTERIVARQWVATALEQMGQAEDEIQVCEVTPKNLLAAKPKDCRRILEVTCFNSNDECIPHVFRTGKKRIYGEPVDGVVDLSEDRYNIVLGTNATDVAKIKVRYYSYPVDKNGLPMVRSDEKQAVIYYIRFCKAMKDDDNRSKIAQDEMMWLRACDIARARKKAAGLNNDRARVIASIRNRLLPVRYRF